MSDRAQPPGAWLPRGTASAGTTAGTGKCSSGPRRAAKLEERRAFSLVASLLWGSAATLNAMRGLK